MTAPAGGPPAEGGGSFLTRKVGPLPMWAWMGLALGAAIGFSAWRSSKGGGSPAPASGGSADAGTATTPYLTFVDENTTLITPPSMPPGGGRPPDSVPTTTPTPAPTTTPAPAPTPTPVGAPPAPAGHYVTVVKYAKGQPAGTPSTLWGIATKEYGRGASWHQIWDAPQNAALRSKRPDPTKIQPGDKVWVPTK